GERPPRAGSGGPPQRDDAWGQLVHRIGLDGGDDIGIDAGREVAQELTDVGLHAAAAGPEGQGVQRHSGTHVATTPDTSQKKKSVGKISR
ncbi:MAG TPA: hypothetical protein VK988_03900, partial [Acidimicrobiales bacterium]|nr:hypothetical protein [Acidimicrobiales bacterium]